MGKLTDSFKKYGFKEWVALLIGLVLMYRPVFRYMDGQFDHIQGWEDIGVLLLPGIMFALGLTLFWAPRSVLDYIGKKFGVETRKKQLQNEEFEGDTGNDSDEPLT